MAPPAIDSRPMRLLWLHQYFATPEGWGAVRTYEFARRFTQAGHAVDVLCSSAYDNTLLNQPQPISIENIQVFVSGARYAPRMGFWKRIRAFLRFMCAAIGFVARRGGRYDLIIASSGPLTMAVPALVARWIHRTPYVFEVIDVWPDSAIEAGVLKTPLLKWLSFRLEASAYRYAAAIVTCSTGMSERVRKKLPRIRFTRNSPPEVRTISNCCDLALFKFDPVLRQTTRQRYGAENDKVVALYTGAMGVSNALGDLVTAVKATEGDGSILWWFAGDGAEKERITALLEYRHVRWLGRLSRQEVAALYMAADINIVTFMHTPLFYENSPNKFFDGIAASLPTIFNRSTWLAPWLEQYGCAIVCGGGAEVGTEMAAALGKLANEPALRRQMGTGALRLAREVFSRDKLGREYLDLLESLQRRS